ncbi:MAG: WecB/TagA/CpsF family glycosyltransferase [Prevotella sp.]|nr:WecB/TagA/CpsF family glycosyltransferase [Prevotella sp.]
MDMLNIHINDITQNELLSQFKEGFIVTPNVDHLVKLQKDESFYKTYQQADFVICDSRILYFFSKLLKHSIRETISGSSFFHEYCKYHKDSNHIKIFILGGKKGVAELAQKRINDSLRNPIIIGAHTPSFHIDEKESRQIAEIVNRSGANAVLVGLGAPKQEKWIVKYKHLMPQVKVWMALGATVDFEAGTLKRAPEIFRLMGLEWFYRFIKEPRRLFKRYFVDDMKFFWYFGKQLLGVYRNPFE